MAYRHETLTHELHLLVNAALDVNANTSGEGIAFKASKLCASPLHVVSSNLLCMNNLGGGHSCGTGDDDDDDGDIKKL